VSPKLETALDGALARALAGTYQTPLYVFREALIRTRCTELRACLTYTPTCVRYACKALTIGAILRIIREEGLWIDASSIGEVNRARHAGFQPREISYTGEGSLPEVYAELLRLGVTIHCTSMDQLRMLADLGGRTCGVRVNSGEGHGETSKTNTGGTASKHGIFFDEIPSVLAFTQENGITVEGFHSHIGSGTDLDEWLRIQDDALAMAVSFPDLRFVNLGGGLPVVYNPVRDRPMPLAEWGAAVGERMEAFSRRMGRTIELHVEPGRYVVAECGTLLAEARSIKRTPEFTFVIVNTGFNHNVRPVMYGSYHPIRFVSGDGRVMGGAMDAIVAGYLCESGDVFTVDPDGNLEPRRFPEIRVGDVMIMDLVGAYSHAMMSEYNSMNLPASVLVSRENTVRVIERRGTLEDLIRREREVRDDERALVRSEQGFAVCPRERDPAPSGLGHSDPRR
jgi:diaminopimelate decarboxylase